MEKMESPVASEAERRDVVRSLRTTLGGAVGAFFLSFSLMLCLFLGARLLTCCCGGSETVLPVPDGRVVLVLLAVAAALALQKPCSAQQGLWAGVGTAAVASAVAAGVCGAESLRGSVLFLAGAPVISGVVLGIAQHDKTFD